LGNPAAWKDTDAGGGQQGKQQPVAALSKNAAVTGRFLLQLCRYELILVKFSNFL
jgi:hypothetical protein